MQLIMYVLIITIGKLLTKSIENFVEYMENNLENIRLWLKHKPFSTILLSPLLVSSKLTSCFHLNHLSLKNHLELYTRKYLHQFVL